MGTDRAMTTYPDDVIEAAHKILCGVSDRTDDLAPEDIARALAAAEAATWRPIETAPKDGTRVLLREVDDEMWVGHWDTSPWVTGVGAWITLENRSDTYEIAATHWRPLPTPPAASTGRG